jgi:hypothetical protein
MLQALMLVQAGDLSLCATCRCYACNISNYEPPDNDKDRDVSERHRSEQVSRFQHGPLAPTCAGLLHHNGPELHAADPSSELSTEQGLGVSLFNY